MGNPTRIEVGEGTLVYEVGDLCFRWRGGEYVEVHHCDVEGAAIEALNVWDHDFDAPRCQTVQEFIEECLTYLDLPD